MRDELNGTRRAMLVALGANLVLGLAKLAAGLMTGAKSLLAESAHSFADACNQVFLLIGLRLSGTHPDELHPYGQGKDRFFWSFLISVLLFAGAALFSIYQGVTGLVSPEPLERDFLFGFVVLALALAYESVALAVTMRDLRRAAKAAGRGFWDHLEATRNTSLKVPFYEDLAAIVGLLLAAGSLGLAHLTDDPRWDAIGALGIGLVLLFVAWEVGADSRALLLGQPMEADERRRLHQVLRSFPEVVHVARLITLQLGPEDVLVNAEVRVQRGLRTDQLEALLDRLNRRLADELPQVRETFIELHPGDARDPTRARVGVRHG